MNPLPNGWIECQSKSRNGKKYYFNKKTKEKVWKLPPSFEETVSEPITSRFSTTKDVNRVSKTPAQERLKRLQNQLQKEVSTKKSSTSKCSVTTSIYDETVAEPITPRFATTKDVYKVPKTTAQDRLKRLQNQLQKEVSTKKSSTSKCSVTTSISTPKSFESTHRPKENNSGCTKNLNIASPKPLSLPPDFSKGRAPKPLKRKLSTDDCVVSKKKNISENIAPKASVAISIDAFNVKTTPKNNGLCNGNADEKSAISTNPFMYSSSSSSNTAIHSKNKKISANCRLQLLRNSVKKIPSKYETEIKNLPYNLSHCQSSTTTSCNNDTLLSNDSGFDFETEKMDWDEIESSEQKQDDEYVSYAHIVKHNLGMLLTKPNNESSNLNTDAFYIVIDTNIFLHNLSFLSGLIELGLSEKTTVLYVPYSVLQELDKIKSHKSDPISQNAQRAVRFINEKLKVNSPSVKGQSAIEDRSKLIDIKCPDDNILNCCLQLKNHVKNVLLLSNDVNLRNKALCNQISVSTKSDLETLPT